MQLAAPSPSRKKKGRGKAQVSLTVGDKEWLSRRLDEVGLSQRDALRRVHMHAGSLTKRVQGEIRWKVEEITKVANLLQVSVQHFLWRMGYPIQTPQTPVVGVVKLDARVSLVTERRQETVPAISDDLAVVALLFEVESGPLRGYDGHALHYRPSGDVRAEAFGALSVIEVVGERTSVVGTLLRSKNKGKMCITLMNGEVIADAKVITASPIEGIRRPT